MSPNRGHDIKTEIGHILCIFERSKFQGDMKSSCEGSGPNTAQVALSAALV